MLRLKQQWRVMETETIQKNEVSPKDLNTRSRRNLKSFTLFGFIMLFNFSIMAQDVIVLKNGDEIHALIQEIGIDDIKYKKLDNKTGPNYILKKSEIFIIKYANGSKEMFFNTASDFSTTQSAPVPKQPSVQNQREQRELYITKSAFSGIKIKNSSGITLLANEITSTLASVPEALRLYDNGVTLKGIGTGFGIAGVVLVGIGFYQSIDSDFRYTPWGWYIGGALCLIPQAILINSGNSKIDSAIGVYNSSIQRKRKSDLSLVLGVTQSGGIGFTLNF